MAKKKSSPAASDPPTMRVERVPIAELSPDPANARKHDRRSVDAIKASLKRFGQQKPLVIDAGNIVRAGNGTLAAAKELGWTHLDCVRTSLSSGDATAYSIADNRASDLSEFDPDVLAGFLSDESIGDVGFTDADLRKLFNDANPSPAARLDAPEGGNLEDGDRADRKNPIILTVNQRTLVMQGIDKLREQENDPTIGDGRALELIVADWLAGK